MKEQEIKHVEGAVAIRALRNGLLIGGCTLLIPAVGFKTALAICMIIYSLNLDEM